MPKLLQINSLVNKGSTGRIVEQISDFFISNGWEGYVAYGRNSNASNSKTVQIGNKVDFILHGIQSKLFDNHGLASTNSTKQFLKKVKSIKPDIIILHNLHGYYINYKKLFEFLKESKIPVLWTLHDCWSITGHCTFFSDINCEKWKTECNNCPKFKNYPSSIFFDNSTQNYYQKKELFNSIENLILLPVSNWLGGIIKQSFLSDKDVCVVNNGIDINAFYPTNSSNLIKKKYAINNKKILLGVATIWDARKGITDYFRLAKTISKEYVIVLVGLSKNQIELLPENIIGIERTENISELNELYSAAEIVLNLSYQESFGMTTVEGYASGTPSIVYNCTASPELITKETGMVVEPGNLDELILAIETITKNGKSYYSVNCRKLAALKYNNQVQIEKYFDLANKMLNNYKN
jgi:putative colanic acid biosynthesis glycosyltransferase